VDLQPLGQPREDGEVAIRKEGMAP